MANESDNLVLVLLREMRSSFDKVTSKLAEHDARFDKLEKSFEQFKVHSTYAMGLASSTNLQCMHTEAKVEEIEARQKQLAADFKKLEHEVRAR
jgi:hypothetical protein